WHMSPNFAMAFQTSSFDALISISLEIVVMLY
ncbi:MAG: hypothetical protein ACI8X3_001752, partial [Saprospiraceae bacterium]